MITQKVFFFASFASLCGIAAVGFNFKDQIISSFQADKDEEIVSHYVYILVKSIKIPSVETSKENFLITDKPNYYCSFKDKENKDLNNVSCEVYKLNSEDIENQSNIDFPTSLLNEKPVENNFYILKIDQKKYEQISKTEKTILLFNKKLNKKFGKLEVISEISISDSSIKTNLILAKISKKEDSQNLATENDYLCDLEIEGEEKKPCEIYAFTTDPTTSNGKTTINREKLVSGKTTVNDSHVSNEKFVLINIPNHLSNEKVNRSYSPVIYKRSAEGSNPTKFLTTQYVNSYVGNLSKENPNNSELLKIIPKSQDYLIVVKTNTNSGDAPSADLTTTSTKIKNYQCKTGTSSNQIIDKTCVLYPIENSEQNKSINLEIIKNSNESIKTKDNKFLQDKFFKLSVNNDAFVNKDYSSDEITISSNSDDNNEATKNYGTVKVIGRINDDAIKMKTDKFLVKSNNSSTETSLSALKCKLNESDTPENCTVQKMTTELGSEKSFKEMDFAQFRSAISAITDIAENKYLLVKFTVSDTKDKDINKLGNTLSIHKSDNSKINDYEIIAPIYSSETNLTSEKTIIIK